MFLFTSEESYKSHYLFIKKKLDFETFTGYKVTQKKICFYAYSVASETFAKDFFFYTTSIIKVKYIYRYYVVLVNLYSYL